jgi:hypothetical protein
MPTEFSTALDSVSATLGNFMLASAGFKCILDMCIINTWLYHKKAIISHPMHMLTRPTTTDRRQEAHYKISSATQKVTVSSPMSEMEGED